MEVDFPELELSRLVQQPGWGLSLSSESLIIDAPSKRDALSLLDAIADSLAPLCSPAAQIVRHYPDGRIERTQPRKKGQAKIKVIYSGTK